MGASAQLGVVSQVAAAEEMGTLAAVLSSFAARALLLLGDFSSKATTTATFLGEEPFGTKGTSEEGKGTSFVVGPALAAHGVVAETVDGVKSPSRHRSAAAPSDADEAAEADGGGRGSWAAIF